MKDLLKKGSIPILLGTGGVGKTTIAAALGLAGASAHRNTAVITVDPARRLRDALGLARLGGSPTSIGEAQLRAAGLPATLKLSAMMLDVKGAWDTVIERFVVESSRRDAILGNPFYQSLTAEFAGSEAFAALQQLYDLHQSAAFDLEVVDTPPAAHAFEFLQTPARMIRLLDSRTSRWLFTPSLTAGRIAIKLASQAARFVVRELERFAGGNVLSTITDFFAATSDSIDAIVERLQKTEALLHSPAVRFVLVTTAEADRLMRAHSLVSEMRAEGLNLSAIVINRFLDERTWSAVRDSADDPLGHLGEISSLRSDLIDGAATPAGCANLISYLENYREQALDQIERVGKFAREIPRGVQLAITPELEVGVRDLAALSRVAGYLMAGTTILKPLESAAANLRRPRRAVRAPRSPRQHDRPE